MSANVASGISPVAYLSLSGSVCEERGRSDVIKGRSFHRVDDGCMDGGLYGWCKGRAKPLFSVQAGSLFYEGGHSPTQQILHSLGSGSHAGNGSFFSQPKCSCMLQMSG